MNAAASAPRRDEIPSAASEFVGRRGELHRLGELLDVSATRMITLVGPGGVGKTTLAAEALRRYRGTTRAAVHWIRLARLPPGADAEVVAEEMVASVVRSDIAGRPAWTCLLEAFTTVGAPRTVLVLDNCEHVLAGVRPLISALLAALPGLTIVATSREPVSWIDEYVVVLPSLPVEHAAELFRRRAELTGRPVPDDREHRALVARICRRVDDNPLFIRLAAARLRHRPPAAVLRELGGDGEDRRLRWSHGVRAGIEDRHRSVADVIAWSFELCAPAERLLLERFSVFAAFDPAGAEDRGGGAEAEAIVAVCADPELPPDELLRGLDRLVDCSLVGARMTETTVRYYLPQSVRVFARERLRRRDGVEARLLFRHRRYYREKVVAGLTAWYGPDEEDWLRWARSSWDDILLGIESGLTDPAEAAVGLDSAATLLALRVPFVTGANRAVARLTERALDVTRGTAWVPAELRIVATARLAVVALWQGRPDRVRQLLDECVAVHSADPRVRRKWRDTAAFDIGLPAVLEFARGQELLLLHEDPRSIEVLARAVRKFAAAGRDTGARRAELCLALARAYFDTADDSPGRRWPVRALEAVAGWVVSAAELDAATAAAGDGPRGVVELGRALLTDRVGTGNTWTAGWIVHCCAGALALDLAQRRADGTADPAELTAAATEIAVLQGGVATLHRSIGVDTDAVPLVARGIRHAAATATAVLGPDGYAAAVRRGARLRPELNELQRYFLGTLRAGEPREDPPAAAGKGSRWHDLSAAEREIAVLVAAGWANSAIAVRRGTSVRTVDAQVVAIRRKLPAATRAAVIEHVPAELTDRVRAAYRQRPVRLRPRG
ncbi:ATP-binding protein [Nocardia wallacei]|uniref:ATP-binding protein n=1 Tax=Nocardia wallacei TaxID=480035 RepID=UPI0016574D20|nr:AAA family ATPase [Nocardia wallacei]